MQRPERIKSTLYGSSPLDQPGTGAAAPPPASTPAAELERPSSPPKIKRTFYFHRDTSERLLNAAEALAATPNAPRGASDLVATAVEQYVDELEETFNGGLPFPQRTGPLQPGPRIR